MTYASGDTIFVPNPDGEGQVEVILIEPADTSTAGEDAWLARHQTTSDDDTSTFVVHDLRDDQTT